MPDGGDQEDSVASYIEQWTEFLERYARGEFPETGSPPPPPLRSSTIGPGDLKREPIPSFEIPLYPERKISPQIAQSIAEFYEKFGFLPPPRPAYEVLRSQMIKEYSLERADQMENYDRCTSLLEAFFGTVCTFSLFRDGKQVVMSVAGDFSVDPGFEMVPEINICSHVVLRRDPEVVELGDMANDWRFAGNPWCLNGSVSGYIGVPILLETDPSSPAENSNPIAVGVLALLDKKPIPPLTPRQTKVMKDVSTMLSAQIRSTWEGWRRGKEARIRTSVSDFLHTALVKRNPNPPIPAVVQGTDPIPLPTDPSATISVSQIAVQQLHNLLEADITVIVDLTPFHASGRHGDTNRTFNWLEDDQRAPNQFSNSSSILSHSTTPKHSAFIEQLTAPTGMACIAGFLSKHENHGQTLFNSTDASSGASSGLEELLPPNSAHIAIPFYSAHRPDILVLVISTKPFFKFSPADATYASNMGIILVAHSVQARIVAADAAKTTFVSQISHELRTPLHGLLGQLELLRDAVTHKDMDVLPELLESAEYCGVALRDIVNDVLDFGKMASATPSRMDDANVRPRDHGQADLTQLLAEGARWCWYRRAHWRLLAGLGDEPAPPLDFIIEFEDRMPLTWQARLDIPGFRRILNNLIGNSLKYCQTGCITVSLRVLHGEVKEGDPLIELRVQDTGSGIDPSFRARLFEPFTQADTFAPGAGLGLYITKSIIARMNGEISLDSELGHGATFVVTLPIELPVPDAPPESIETCRYVVSNNEYPPINTPLLATESESSDTTTLIDQNLDPLPFFDSLDDDDDDEDSAPLTTLDTQTEPPPLEIPDEYDPGPLRVLVIDDNLISRRILVTLLKRQDVITAQAEDGIEGVEVYKTFRPHVVWTDVSMPRMDGVTAAREMRKIEAQLALPPAYIAAITGLGQSDDDMRKEGLLGEAALDEWLVKGQTDLKALRDNLALVRKRLRIPSRIDRPRLSLSDPPPSYQSSSDSAS